MRTDYTWGFDVGYPEVSIARMITNFVAAARAANVRILAWVGPSIVIPRRSAQYTDSFFRARVGASIPYLSLLSGRYPHANQLHFTPAGYSKMKSDIEALIVGGKG
jgi:hypothetical protein